MLIVLPVGPSSATSAGSLDFEDTGLIQQLPPESITATSRVEGCSDPLMVLIAQWFRVGYI